LPRRPSGHRSADGLDYTGTATLAAGIIDVVWNWTMRGTP